MPPVMAWGSAATAAPRTGGGRVQRRSDQTRATLPGHLGFGGLKASMSWSR